MLNAVLLEYFHLRNFKHDNNPNTARENNAGALIALISSATIFRRLLRNSKSEVRVCFIPEAKLFK